MAVDDARDKLDLDDPRTRRGQVAINVRFRPIEEDAVEQRAKAPGRPTRV
jgi:hypothetical protein